MQNYTPARFAILLATCATLFFTACSSNEQGKRSENQSSQMYLKKDLQAPVANQQPKELTIHGDTRIDPYYWLNDRDDPEVTAYLEAENDYARNMMSHLAGFEDELYDEIIGRIKQTDLSVPYLDNGYWYYTRYDEGKEYAIHVRRKGNMEAEEEVMLDVNVLAEPYDFYNAGGLSVSPDNRILSYGEDTLSRRIYTIQFKDLKTGKMLPDLIPNTTGRAVWANDNKTVFYSMKDEALRSYKIFRHVLGTPVSQDVEVWHETDETFSTFVYKSKSRKYLIIAPIKRCRPNIATSTPTSHSANSRCSSLGNATWSTRSPTSMARGTSAPISTPRTFA